MKGRFKSRRTLAVLAAGGVVVAGLGVAWRSHASGGDDGPELLTAVPAELAETGGSTGERSVGDVVTSQDYVWVSGYLQSDPGTRLLWRHDGEGVATVIGGIPGGAWLVGPGPDSGFAIGRLRCTSGDGLDPDISDPRCSGPMVGEVVLADGDGEEQGVVQLWEDEDGDAGSAPTIVLAGAGPESIWVRSQGTLWEVGFDGDLRGTLPPDTELKSI